MSSANSSVAKLLHSRTPPTSVGIEKTSRRAHRRLMSLCHQATSSGQRCLRLTLLLIQVIAIRLVPRRLRKNFFAQPTISPPRTFFRCNPFSTSTFFAEQDAGRIGCLVTLRWKIMAHHTTTHNAMPASFKTLPRQGDGVCRSRRPYCSRAAIASSLHTSGKSPCPCHLQTDLADFAQADTQSHHVHRTSPSSFPSQVVLITAANGHPAAAPRWCKSRVSYVIIPIPSRAW